MQCVTVSFPQIPSKLWLTNNVFSQCGSLESLIFVFFWAVAGGLEMGLLETKQNISLTNIRLYQRPARWFSNKTIEKLFAFFQNVVEVSKFNYNLHGPIDNRPAFLRMLPKEPWYHGPVFNLHTVFPGKLFNCKDHMVMGWSYRYIGNTFISKTVS